MVGWVKLFDTNSFHDTQLKIWTLVYYDTEKTFARAIDVNSENLEITFF